MKEIDVDQIKRDYPPGTRIKLICMNDPYAPVETGTCGTVLCVDDMGTVFPKWDNGRSLGVVPSEDNFRKLTQEEAEVELANASRDEGAPSMIL